MEEKDLKSPEQNINQNDEEKLEEKVEEVAPVDEEKKEGSISQNLEFVPFDANVDGDVVNIIESKRLGLLASYKKSKLISRIFMFVVVALVVAAIILVPMNGLVFKILGYSLAGVALVSMLVFYIVTRNKIPSESKIYMDEVTKLINCFIFNGKDFSELAVSPSKKVTRIEAAVDRLYKEGIDAGSRNAVKGKYKGRDFEVIELALYYPGQTKKNTRSVGFLGKYITLSNNLKFEGRYIFNYKNADESKVVDQPTDIEDLEKVYDENNLEVYGKDKKDINAIFGTEFLKELRKFEIGSPLMNLALVVWSGHTAIYLSYDDSVTTLPFEHPFQKEPQESYQRDLIRALDLFSKY